MGTSTLDLTTKAVGPFPSVTDTGEPIVLTYNTTIDAKMAITNPGGAGSRATIATTLPSPQAGYATFKKPNNITKLTGKFVRGAGFHAWRDPFPAGLLNLSTEAAICHSAFLPNRWEVGYWGPTGQAGQGLQVVTVHPYATPFSNTAIQTIQILIDKTNGVLYVTGADGIEVPVSHPSFKLWNCTYAQMEIYYDNAATEPRSAILDFSATDDTVTTPSTPQQADVATTILGWFVKLPTKATINATAMRATAALLAPTLIAGASVHATKMTATAALRNPIVAIGGDVIINATAMTAVAELKPVAIRQFQFPYTLPILFGNQGDVLIEALPMTATAEVKPAIIGESATVNATAMTATATVIDPAVQTSAIVTPTPMTATAAVNPASTINSIPATAMTAAALMPSSTVGIAVTVNATVMTAAAAVNPAIVSAPNDVIITTTPMIADAAMPAPTLQISMVVNATKMTATAAMPAPVVQIPLSVSATVMTAAAVFRNPTVDAPINVLATAMTADALLLAPTLVHAIPAVVMAASAKLFPPPIAFVTKGGASAVNIASTLTGLMAGDFILVVSWNASNAAVGLSTGFTDLGQITAGNLRGRLCYKRATATTENGSLWSFTNGQATTALVYRNVGSVKTPVTASNSAATVITFPSATLSIADGTSWFVYLDADLNGTAQNATLTGYTKRDGSGATLNTNANVSALDSNGGLSSNPAGGTFSTTSSTSVGCYGVELAAA